MTDISFQSVDSSSSNIGNVRHALAALHAKVAMLENDRDSHAQAAAKARNEHEEYKSRMESELNRERMIAAERERQLLEDVAAAEAELHHLKERLRASSLNPLPQRGMLQTEADRDFEHRANQQIASERQRIEDAEHEISKLEAERQVLESANVQLDQTIQHLLRSNEDLLQMLRITPRSNSPNVNPASARGAMEGVNPSYNGRARPLSSTSSWNGLPLGPNNNNNNNYNPKSRTSSPLQQPPLHYKNSLIQSPNNSKVGNAGNIISTLHQKETMSSLQRNRKNGAGGSYPADNVVSRVNSNNNNVSSSSQYQHYRDPNTSSTFERLAQPQRSCSRNRAVSPPHCTHTRIAYGTAKNTARRFLTQELRSHATEAIPH